MLKYGPQKLDYFELVKSARKLPKTAAPHPVRVALLGDCALQQTRSLLEVLLRRSGVEAEVFEAPFDTIDPLVLDPDSALYQFKPDFVVFVNAAQRFRHDLFLAGKDGARNVGESAPPAGAARRAFLDQTVETLVRRWRAVGAHSQATVLQTNLVTPLERTFGQFEHTIPHSTTAIVAALNHRLSEEARKRPSTFLVDVDFVAASLGKLRWFDERLWTLAKTPCALECLPHLVQAIVDIVCACRGAVVKCVVLDLDNTLWGGVIGDDGLDGIRLGHLGEGEAFVAFQAYLKQLPARGILLAVCSKNDREAAMLPFSNHADMVLREEDIAVFVANWENKADNIRSIARELNIGLDTIVFLDDNPFERNLVRELCPEVIVPELPEDPAEYVRAISEWNLFETTSFSETDEKRAELYRQRAEGEAARADFTSLEGYLRSLEMVATIGRFDAYHLPRIAQLLQRSNQFNLTTRRYSVAECEALMGDRACYPFHLSLRDKLGDHGLIAVAILRQTPEAVHVDSLLMSCRVLKRGVEELALHTMVEYAKKVGRSLLTAEYIPTAKNGMVKELYDGFGFERTETAPDGTVRYALRVDQYRPREIFVHVES